MLRLFFFVMTYLTDYRGTAEFMRGGFTLGLINAGVASVMIVGSVLRRWRARRSGLGADVRA